jgi:hypothetical protein
MTNVSSSVTEGEMIDSRRSYTRRHVLGALAGLATAGGVLTGLATAGIPIGRQRFAPAAPHKLDPVLAASFQRTLRSGSSGPDVVELQIRVAGWAADGPAQTFVGVDGSYGPQTAAAVRRFQLAHGLAADGVAGPATLAALDQQTSPDGSTAHFDWSEFQSHDGSGFGGGRVGEGEVRENVRRLMHKLEALRRKGGDRPVTVNSGFRSIAHNRAVGGAGNSMHMFGVAADIAVSGLSTRQVYRIAETCGFSGLEAFTNSWQHCDSRVEHPNYGSGAWWWESGTVA